MFASSAILVHSAIWRATRSRISAGVVLRTSAPKLSSRVRTSGTAIARSISACSRLMIACGVRGGAAKPDHDITSKSGRPDSAIVGMSEKPFHRALLVTAGGATCQDDICVAAGIADESPQVPGRKPNALVERGGSL